LKGGPETENAVLRRRVVELELSLKSERERADVERKRADAATESSARAWRLAWQPKAGRDGA
jgi:hypothetical protein